MDFRLGKAVMLSGGWHCPPEGWAENTGRVKRQSTSRLVLRLRSKAP